MDIVDTAVRAWAPVALAAVACLTALLSAVVLLAVAVGSVLRAARRLRLAADVVEGRLPSGVLEALIAAARDQPEAP